jgi:ribosome biogenesis GTPase
VSEGLEGTVLKIGGSASIVDVGGRTFRCDLRAKVSRKQDQRLAVGDRVKLTSREGKDEEGLELGVIEAVEPRRSRLRRPRSFKRDQILCANIDLVVLVVSTLEPDYKRNFIDRVLVAVEREELDAAIVFNKADLADRRYLDVVREDAAIYEKLGYPSGLVSAKTGEGIPELRQLLKDRISVITGPSGVGKSTLLNVVQPGLELKTGEVSESTGRGKHTTTSAELIKLAFGGYVADTPGIRAFGLWDVTARELAMCFPELREVMGRCKFNDCTHRAEPGCAVLKAVQEEQKAEDGLPVVDEERYDSYLKLRDELEAEEAQRDATKRR